MGNRIVDCGEISASFDETEIEGKMTILDLLQQPYDKHIGQFEIPTSLRDLFCADEVNAVITWYLNWKLTEPIETCNTCTIKKVFGFYDGTKVIIAINLYKYLRNKGYDPEVMEQFVNKQ
jgi:hypothetical protein